MPDLFIREIRKQRGLSQQALAAAAGVSRSQLSEIETEATPVNTARLAAIAKALDVSMAELFLSAPERAVIAAIRAAIRRPADDLLARITTFCYTHGMSKAEFGKRALKDPAFVYDLEQGRDIRRSTATRVVEFMTQSGAS